MNDSDPLDPQGRPARPMSRRYARWAATGAVVAVGWAAAVVVGDGWSRAAAGAAPLITAAAVALAWRAARRAAADASSRTDDNTSGVLAAVLDCIPEGVVIVDHDLRVVQSNRVASRLLDGQHQSLGGSLMRIGDRPTAELLAAAASGPVRTSIDSSASRTLHVAGRWAEGNGHGVLVLRDLSSENRLAEQAQQHAHLAAVGELSAGVAHDFNNLLQGITAVAEAMQGDSTLSRRARADVDTIIGAARSGCRITRRLLDFSRRSPLTRRLVDLRELMVGLLPLLERMLPSTISLRLLAPPEPLTVLADPSLIQQVAVNLVVNSRDAMPGGGRIELRLRRAGSERASHATVENLGPGPWIELAVVDDGCGIPDEVQSRVFEPFFTTKDGGTGTGLGLSQVYGIVRQHDGHLRLSSRPGAGTRMTVLLPECRAGRIEPPPADLRVEVTGPPY